MFTFVGSYQMWLPSELKYKNKYVIQFICHTFLMFTQLNIDYGISIIWTLYFIYKMSDVENGNPCTCTLLCNSRDL